MWHVRVRPINPWCSRTNLIDDIFCEENIDPQRWVDRYSARPRADRHTIRLRLPNGSMRQTRHTCHYHNHCSAGQFESFARGSQEDPFAEQIFDGEIFQIASGCWFVAHYGESEGNDFVRLLPTVSLLSLFLNRVLLYILYDDHTLSF